MTKSVKTVYHGTFYDLNLERVKLPNGHRADLEIVRHPGAAAIVPLIDPRRLILIRQYRHAVGGYLYEIPAGKLSPGERPLSCAKRELEEEIGYRAGSIRKLGSIYTAPGFCDELIHIYRASRLRKTTQRLEASEVIQAVEVPVGRVRKMIQTGKIRDAKTIVGIHFALWGKSNRLND